MQANSDWRPAIVVTCSLALFLVVVAWNFRKNSKKAKNKPKSQEPTVNSESKTDAESELPTTEESSEPRNSTEPKQDASIQSNGHPKDNKLSRDTNQSIDQNVNQTANQNAVQETEATTQEAPKTAANDIPDPRWVKVGQVQELYFYPLKSGRGKDVKTCKFTEYGISVKSEKQLTLRDRMFLVYNEETRRFQTGRNYPTLILVSLSAVDETKVKLEAVGMPSVIFKVPRSTKKSSEAVECTMWWGEPVKCIDCGPEPAEWISRFLTGTNSGLRLGCSLTDRRQMLDGPWERYAKVYNTLRDEDSGLFADLTSYMLMTSQSLAKLNEKLKQPVPALQFRPNILVSATDPFEEDNWEWIKIGDHAVIRNVKPCTRCKMVKVNPETGVADEEEPLKTLKSFRELTEPDRISVEGKAPTLGIYCGLYITGKVKIGDDVFVHMPDDSSESNRRETEGIKNSA